MSVAMAFFSVSLVMSVAGIKVSDIAKVDLHPSAVKRSYFATQARVVKYYSNMRGFYEIESMLHTFRSYETAEASLPSAKRQSRKTTTRPAAVRILAGWERRRPQSGPELRTR